jgi:hypothetical protein
MAKAGSEPGGPATRGGEVPKLLRGHLVEELLREGLRPCGGRRRAEVPIGQRGGTQRAVTVAAVRARMAGEMDGVDLAQPSSGEALGVEKGSLGMLDEGMLQYLLGHGGLALGRRAVVASGADSLPRVAGREVVPEEAAALDGERGEYLL